MLNMPSQIPLQRIKGCIQWTIDCVRLCKSKLHGASMQFDILFYSPCHYIVLVNGLSIKCMNNKRLGLFHVKCLLNTYPCFLRKTKSIVTFKNIDTLKFDYTNAIYVSE